jgi:beta-glucosidase-like glycosyl hydrolase
MPSYLVETYLARCRSGERADCERRARAAAAELSRAGTRVRFGGVIHVPEDETCFFVFDAPSSDDAALVAEHAALGPVRVVEAVTSGEEH